MSSRKLFPPHPAPINLAINWSCGEKAQLGAFLRSWCFPTLIRSKWCRRVPPLRRKVLDPRAAVKDADKLASDPVKKDLDTLKKYQSATNEISAMLVRAFFVFLLAGVVQMALRSTYRLRLSQGGLPDCVSTCSRGASAN